MLIPGPKQEPPRELATWPPPQRGPDSGQRTAGPPLRAPSQANTPLSAAAVLGGCPGSFCLNEGLLQQETRGSRNPTPHRAGLLGSGSSPGLTRKNQTQIPPATLILGRGGHNGGLSLGGRVSVVRDFPPASVEGGCFLPMPPQDHGGPGAPEHPLWTLELLPSARWAGRCAEQMPWGQPSFPWVALEPPRACRREAGRARPTGWQAGWLGGSLPGKERGETWPPGGSLCSHQGVLIDRGFGGKGRPPLLRSQTQPDPVGA